MVFFKTETVAFNIVDVIKLEQENINMQNSGRNFSALSFRLRADTVLKSRGGEYHLFDNHVLFAPSRLDYSRYSKVDELIVIHLDVSNYHAHNLEFFLPQNPEPLKKLFIKILDVWSKKEIGYKYECSAILNEILALCYRENYELQTEVSKIQRSVDYLLAHYRECDISVATIAKQSFVSEVYFRKLFKAEYGISPQKYIINLRIQNAKALISAGYYSLKEIAEMSGYNDYKYFSVEFKKTVGVSPSQYVYNYK